MPELIAMHHICNQCPVRVPCARYALYSQRGIEGGFWAGVWLPWPRTTAEANCARDRARRLLQATLPRRRRTTRELAVQ